MSVVEGTSKMQVLSESSHDKMVVELKIRARPRL